MQYFWKLFKWENGTERTELTQYLMAPIFLEPRCNGELSSGLVTLDRMPTNIYRQEFAPKTKFTLERWMSGELDRYYDYCVDRDEVEHYIGCPELCTHRIQLIEASVFAQGLNCDNFALTYELNDVTLNYKTVVPIEEKAVPTSSTVGSGINPVRPSWDYGGTAFLPYGVGDAWCNTNKGNYTLHYANGYIYSWSGIDGIEGFTKNLNGLVSENISFNMPIIECFWNNGTTVPVKLFDCPVRCTINRVTLRNGLIVPGSGLRVLSYLYNNPSSIANIAAIGADGKRILYNENGAAGFCATWTGSYRETIRQEPNEIYVIKVFRESEITQGPAMINTTNNSSNRMITFSTTALTQTELDEGLTYRYDLGFIIEPYQSGAFRHSDTNTCVVSFTPPSFWESLGGSRGNLDFMIVADTSFASDINCRASVSFDCVDLTIEAPPNPFLLKGSKYNCYDLFRRAMLTCDTQIFDNNITGLDEMYDENLIDIGIQYPIEVDSNWLQKMKKTNMYESIFENKNLWEVLLQIGHYLHAIPYLEFARNGKDTFLLKFKQLGSSLQKTDNSRKITVFNSLTLDNFFTQYDSYVTNLFSPQNEIEEWLTCKTSDSSYLVSNDTAELQTKYNITEIIQFDIIYNGVSKSALNYIFEMSIYNTLSSKTNFTPAKWSALYYEMGTSKILGLNYVPPTVNNDGYMALKTIVSKVFEAQTDKDLKFNDLRFHIRYKTQDSLRITQIRPDLENFVKSSVFEKYPHHEQFFNQQDKIIDSERFSANLWGKLIRVANGVYQCQEYATHGQEKEPGDLIELYGKNYYVTECENEYYADAIFQKVTYSMNFNQLAQIVTIPSEPRFYEVSERSMVRREVRLLDFIKLSTLSPDISIILSKFINPDKWHEFIRDLLFADNGNAQLPNFAYTNFKGDKLRIHYNLNNNDISVLFPKSGAETLTDGSVQPKPNTQSTAVIVPVLHFPLRNAIVFEWDMDDNFKAADCIDTNISGGDTADNSYFSLQPVRYCDVYGRADLFDFKLFYKDDWTETQIQRLPFAEEDDFKPTEADSTILIPETLSIGLDKDNREALSFNYQLSLLHSPTDDDSEDFVIFPNLFGEKNERLKAALLNNTVSVLDESVRIDGSTIVAEDVIYNFSNIANGLTIDFAIPSGTNLNEVKSVVLYDKVGTEKIAYIAKNVSKLPNEKKLQPWYIYPVFNN